MLTDSHCHLDKLDITPWANGLDEVISECLREGVTRQLCIAVNADNIEVVKSLADCYRSVYATVGVHPMEPHEVLLTVDELVRLADHPKVVGVGETGLDYFYSEKNKDNQQLSFRTHLQAAKQLQLPVVVHTRQAQEDTLNIIKQEEHYNGVLHCFTESWDMAKAALDLGYYISLSGIVTFKNAYELKEVAKKIPADRLLIETDSPWLAPVPFRGKPNYPFYVKQVAEYVAQLRGVTAVDLAQTTTDNFLTLFSAVKNIEKQAENPAS